jgi:hypothetical protein
VPATSGSRRHRGKEGPRRGPEGDALALPEPDRAVVCEGIPVDREEDVVRAEQVIAVEERRDLRQEHAGLAVADVAEVAELCVLERLPAHRDRRGSVAAERIVGRRQREVALVRHREEAGDMLVRQIGPLHLKERLVADDVRVGEDALAVDNHARTRDVP